ncbi:hypothetical protein U9M48_018844 [Paspalum notatum var. saurae]|uniref:Uncharacterized protein n=1 Tax=Paspalum notatum var. saurae TaxID=547442 RepID=A0AAQ3TBY7_PASNO
MRAPSSPSPRTTCSPSSRAAPVTGDHGHLCVVLLDSAHLPSEDPTAVIAAIGEISATTPDLVLRSRDRVTRDDPATLLYSSGARQRSSPGILELVDIYGCKPES